jgi:DNA polymerase-3 subunit delta
MSATTSQRLIRAAVQQGAFAPVYLLHGEDDYLKEDAVRQLVNAAVDPGMRDFNYEMRRAADVDAGTLGSLLDTLPMMAERRVVVLRDPAALKKDARKVLDRYLAKPSPDTMLLMVAPAGSKEDKALLAASQPLEFQPLTGDRVPKWIVFHAEKEMGVTISEEAVRLLQDAVGDDLPQLAIELEKCASLANGAEIGEPIVTAVVGVRREETPGMLLDAVAMRDGAAALALLPGVLMQPKTSAVQLVMALATQTLGIGWALERRAAGVPARGLTGELFTLLKGAGGPFLMRSWGDATAAWARAVDRWRRADVDRALDALLDADRALKESRLSSDEQLLGTLVLELCGDPAARRSRAA